LEVIYFNSLAAAKSNCNLLAGICYES